MADRIHEIVCGDSREVLATLDDDTFDAVVTDPPYGLSKVREKDVRACLAAWLANDTYEHGGKGFMGKKWDSFVPGPDLWREVLRVLKPGGHALVFAGSRMSDFMALSLRLAGFEVRDTIMWMYGSGWPKAKNALKPAYEPVIVCRKPLIGTVAANVLEHGTGALNIDACRIACEGGSPSAKLRAMARKSGNAPVDNPSNSTSGPRRDANLYMAERPSEALGRWPANVILDEDAAAALDEQSGVLKGRGNKGPSKGGGGMFGHGETINNFGPGDSGGASRFFYCAKASKAEKTCKGAVQCKHPTVKPLALMRYLCRLVTPPGGIILDPFAGSGSTICAAKQEGFDAVGVEREDEYAKTARQRVAATGKGNK